MVWTQLREILFSYNETFAVLLFIVLYLFLMLTVGVYLAFAIVLERKYWLSCGQFVYSLVYLLEIFLLMNSAHKVTTEVKRCYF